ncbi:unnamed protein product [Rotaria magnacalcarata]|uniref:Uncharacterized protein n=3 Tax=Rotaria magnacalcarata TaxID=392030 RepID=A0A815NN31_9BILA|nr:unnamed protein product [Rotaria magnacalcarata]
MVNTSARTFIKMTDGSESQSNSQKNTLPSSSSSPIPVLQSYSDRLTAYEESMLHRINAIIGGLFTQPDYQTPYRFTFCWIANDESEFNYSVKLIIDEPPIPRFP